MWHIEERVTFQDKIEVVFSEKNSFYYGNALYWEDW